MLNIWVALQVWAPNWMAKTVEIHCDNAAVVSVLETGRTKDPILVAISRNTFMRAAKFDIFVKVSHVPGKDNVIADVLSSWDNSQLQKETLCKMVPNAYL